MTQVDRSTFKSNTATLYADNSTGNIGAGDLRSQMNDIADSTIFKSTGYTAAPSADDDDSDTAGNGVFGIGDVWVDESNNKAYICLDNTTATAVWTEITYNDSGVLDAVDVPAVQEIAVWVDPTTLKGFPQLTWDDSSDELNLDGDLVVSGTVDGRDIAADGTKLDGIPASPIETITTINENVGGGTLSYNVTNIEILTGDGLELSNPGPGTARLYIANNDITKDLADRTLLKSDNNSFITNEGASTTVRWTLPITSTLDSVYPRLVATFFKTADQTMEIVGANTVTINGNTETGSDESLIEICDTPYETIAYVIYSGTANEYYVIQTNDVNKSGTPQDNQVAVWSGDGTIEGSSDVTWDGSILDVNGEIKHNWSVNAQTGTSYTLALTDRGSLVTMNNSSANTLTIPDNATVAIPVGTEIRVIQIGSGTTSIAGDTGVTLNGVSAGSGDVAGQWDEVRLYKIATDEWYAVGAIGAVA